MILYRRIQINLNFLFVCYRNVIELFLLETMTLYNISNVFFLSLSQCAALIGVDQKKNFNETFNTHTNTHKHTPNEMSMDCRCNAINTIAIGHQIVSATLYLICHAHAYTQFHTHTTIVNGYLAHARPHFGELKFIRWLWTNSIKLLADNRKLIFDSILVVLFFRLPARFRCINIFCLWL